MNTVGDETNAIRTTLSRSVFNSISGMGRVGGHPRLLHAGTMRHTDRDHEEVKIQIKSLDLGP